MAAEYPRELFSLCVKPAAASPAPVPLLNKGWMEALLKHLGREWIRHSLERPAVRASLGRPMYTTDCVWDWSGRGWTSVER